MDEQRDNETESGEERVDAEGRNPTQQRMDDEGVEPVPVDASWSGEEEGEGAPVAAAGPAVPAESFETSTEAEASGPSASAEAAAGPNEPIFEPDVPLVAEVNREAGGRSRKGVIAALAGGFAVVGAALLRWRRRR
jgi:hypothetical protein